MKNAAFGDLEPCACIINLRFGGTFFFDLQARRNNASEKRGQTVANRLTTTVRRALKAWEGEVGCGN
jgi:hypothetical protein